MLGAIIGDIAGSPYEFNNVKSKDIELFGPLSRFTDDSVMTAAVAEACIAYTQNKDIVLFERAVVNSMRLLGRKYLAAGYGGRFERWLLTEEPKPYYSYGNGSAMRVSPVAYAADSLEEAELLGETSAKVTHNHPEGIKGARAVAAAVYMALHGKSQNEIRAYVEEKYYNIDFSLDEIKSDYSFDVSCQGSVPQAMEAFFEAKDFEDAIRNAISIGGDSDTIACIAGAISEPYFGIPEDIRSYAIDVIKDTDILKVYNEFTKAFDIK